MWKGGGGIGEAVTTQESFPSSGFTRAEMVGVIPMVEDRKEAVEDMKTGRSDDGGRTNLTTPLHQPPTPQPTPHQPSPLHNQQEERNHRRSERSYTGSLPRGGEEEFMAARKWMAPRNWDSPPTTPMTMTTTARAENTLPQQNPTQRRVRRKKRMEGALSGGGSGGSSNDSTGDVQGLGVVGVDGIGGGGVESLEERRGATPRGVRGYHGAI